MEYIIIGQIINTHGVHGEVKVYPITHDMKRFSILEKVYVGENKIHLNIEKIRYHKGLVILKFAEFNNMNDVIAYKDNYIYIRDEDKLELSKDSFYIYDLVGCKVLDVVGNNIGYIDDVLLASGNDIYVIKNPSNNKSYLIPAVKEFVKDINIKKQTVVIDPIEGMIE